MDTWSDAYLCDTSSSAFPATPLGFTILGKFFVYVTLFLIQQMRQSHSVFVDGACWVCFRCRYLPVQNINVRIFWIRAMERMCAQTRPWFILSSERVWENGVRGKNPLYRRLRVGSNPWCCIRQNSEPNTIPTELFQPICVIQNKDIFGPVFTF